MHKKSINRPIGGLDQDSEDRLISPEDYRFLENGGNTVQLAGTLTNIKGNLPITTYYYPYNGSVVPQGENVAIGSVEDTQENSVVWFIWNSTGKHHILRHYRDMTNTDNPYGVVHQVIQYDFGWTRETRITSASIVYGNVGDLLYWTDNVKPREINLTKANVVDKKKSWNLYFPVTCDLANTFTFTFKDFSGATIRTLIVGLSDPTNREQIIADITAYINGLNNVPVIAESCDCKLTFTEKVSGTVWDITSDCPQLLIPARLEGDGFWYGPALEERFFDRAKYQFLTPNTMTFAQDSDYEPNYVQRKVFQSRLQALYDDDSGTDLALGVWSQIGINNLGCDGTSNPLYNYIDVNFNGQDIADRKTLVVLKKVRLIMREHNDGSNRSIIDLEPCDFLDYDYVDNKWVVHYNFYNDIISSAVDPALAAKLFDNVPLKADSELFTKNRMVEGGILEGYDAPDCINAKAQMEFSEVNPNEFVTISGFVRIYNAYAVTNPGNPNVNGAPPLTLQNRGVIYQNFLADSPDDPITKYPMWGGISYSSVTQDQTYRYLQQLTPEGAFPVYLSGHQFYAITKQVQVKLINGVPTIGQYIGTIGGNGVLDATTQSKIDEIVAFLSEGKTAPYDQTDIYQYFEIPNVPKGEYVVRVGSPWSSFDDKLGKGTTYNLNGGNGFQKTSANVQGVVSQEQFGDGNYRENIFEIKVNAQADVNIGTFFVTDQRRIGESLEDRIALCGFLVDGGDGDSSLTAMKQGAYAERQLTELNTGLYFPYKIYQTRKVTDHNGYWFHTTTVNESAPSDTRLQEAAKAVDSTGTQIFLKAPGDILYYSTTSALKDLFDDTIVASPNFDPFTNTFYQFILPVTNPDVSQYKTFVQGRLVDNNGAQVSGVVVVYTETGRYAKSDVNGNWRILVYADSSGVISSNGQFRQDYVVFNGSICNATFSDNDIFTDITPIGTGGYTIDNPFIVPDIIVVELFNPTIKARKRGGNYVDGIRLCDNAGRFCSVAKAYDLYIPFITEDIGRYSIENFSGVVYPANTFKYGKPSIKWVLDPTTVFPTWATTFQWMRTLNSIYARYIQWVANQVTYLSAVATADTPEVVTTFQNGDATALKISLSNLTIYKAQNNESLVGYEYQAGDRLRLIARRDNSRYDGIVDFEITSFDSTTQSIIVPIQVLTKEVESGTLFEIFNPKSVSTTDEQIFYEVGETVKINNGIPEKYSGVFTNGDTYWRTRIMPVSDDSSNFAAIYPDAIEDASISDFYKSDDQDIGRVGIIDPNFKQLYNPSKIRFSNQYSIETAKNGLSSFEELNQKDLPREYGTIKRMMFTNNNLVCIMENKEVSNYIGLVTLMQASKGAESGLVSVTDSFLGTEYIHKQMLGTDYAGSVTLSNEGVIFAYNNRSANAWKYTQEESVISDVKMINYFNKLSVDGISDAVSIFDRYKEEYVLTVWRKYQNKSTVVSVIKFSNTEYKLGVSYPDGAVLPELGSRAEFQFYLNGQWNTTTGVVNSIVAVTGGSVVSIVIETTTVYSIGMVVNVICSIPETIAWNESKQKWSSFYSFAPNCYGVLRTEIYSWKDGKIWIHNKNDVRNNFYGEQFTTKLNVVVNQEPDETKNFYALYLESEQDAGFDWSIPVVKNTNQLSRVLKNIFEKREQFWFAEFKRDLNTSGVVNPILNGRQLRSSALELQMENDYAGQIVLRNIVCAYLNSARQ